MLSPLTQNGRLSTALAIALLTLAFSTSTAQADKKCDAKVITPKDGVIKLYNGRNLDGLSTWLKDAKHEDPRDVFSVKDGILQITGDGYGYVRTNDRYRDYHLVIEFRWGKRTWKPRVDRAKDSGVLVHCIGPDGGYSNTFMAGIEAQIIEGGVGDFIVCSGKDTDGSNIPVALSAETRKDRDGEKVWHAGGEKVTIPGGRINWYGRDPDWKDVIGFRGKEDVESPGQEWTRMDVICKGSTVTILVNGVLVNKGFDASTTAGQIMVQTEGAELFVRRWELWPLGKTPK